MAGVLGAKYVVGVGLFITSVLSLFIPLSADAGVAALIVVRVIQGLSQVPRYFPCVNEIQVTE